MWSFFFPPVLDQSPYGDDIVRMQQTKATIASVALGGVAAGIAKKPWPFLVAIFISGLLLAEFEAGRRRDRT